MKSKFVDCIRATLFTLLVIGLSRLVINVDYKAFNTFDALTSKFNYTDLYYSHIYENKEVETSIVLINIADAGRREIGLLINTICAQHPKSVGLDVSFHNAKDSIIDSDLLGAIGSCNNISLPVFNNTDFTDIVKQNSGVTMGSNLFITDEYGIVKFVELSADQNKYLFGQHIADVQKTSDNLEFKEINYFGSHLNFLHFNITDILGNKSDINLNDKIVLIGYNGKDWEDKSAVEDKYYTPLDITHNRLVLPPTSGIVIHANVIKNIKENNFIKISPRWIDYVILILLLLLSNWFYLSYFRKLSIVFFLRCRIFQIILTAILAYFIFVIFHFFRIKFGLAEWILVIIASFELSMIYAFLMNNLGNKFGFESYIYRKLEQQ